MTADTFAKVLAAATFLAVWPSTATTQDLSCSRGDVEVRGLDFVGNRTFSSAELANVIITTPSAWARRTLNFPLSAKRCLDRAEFANDRYRLLLFYRRHGFPDVSVDTALIPAGLGGVKARFTIEEGAPSILRSFVISGVDSIRRRDYVLRQLPISAGDRFDRTKIDATADSIKRRLQNSGYPSATVINVYSAVPSPTGQLVDDSMAVEPGPLTRISSVEVMVRPAPGHTQQISDAVVRRLADLDSGDIVRSQRLADAQRALYETDAYVHVGITLDSAHGVRVGPDSAAPLLITVSENTMHAARVGTGYGTLDCFRTSAELDDYNFLGGARRMQLQARVSKIGIGEPLDGAPQLCPQARRDPYSTHLNYYFGTTLKQPFLLGLRTVPTITAYTSRVSEYNAYVRTTSIGGLASVVWQPTRRTGVTFNYAVDFGRTEAQPALFCAVFNLCAAEDRERVQQNQRLAVISAIVGHDWSNSIVNPGRGGNFRFELRHASPLVFSDTALQFNTILGDASRYIPVGGGNVLALHVNIGGVFGRGFRTNTGFIPPQQRMYAGGPTTVRGFAQNELGAATYLAQTINGRAYDTVTVGTDTFFRVSDTVHTFRRAVPVGGNSLLVTNVELRLRSPIFPELLQFGLFVDGGDVWNRGTGSTFEGFKYKVTPGVQVAALTPVGPIRVVVGYNPYPRPRGPIYYENTSAIGGALPCVSPGNTIPVTNVASAGETPVLVQSETRDRCIATFTPAERRTFRSRLTFGLAIGQAF